MNRKPPTTTILTPASLRLHSLPKTLRPLPPRPCGPQRSLFPQTMWKNTSPFPEACHALLTLLFGKSALLAGNSQGKKARIIDLGIGCRGQMLAIPRALSGVQYSGTTNNLLQLAFLEERMGEISPGDKGRAQLRLGDGANSDIWD
ncbi:hypothetical protein HOY80DRAFT_953250 [Tuber brumale]|nr:hypothetical protein HOY80DRAFT_953250 [Tuber brumale]